MANIKISQLSSLVGALSSSDFFPIDQSSSLTTYRATLTQLQAFTSTGSFTGSLTGALTGTSSWANKAISASYANTSTSASYALSASYANVAASLLGGSGIGGSGTANYVPLWTAGTTLGNSAMYYTASRNAYYLDGKNFMAYAGNQSYITCRAAGTNANFVLESAYSASDAWTFSIGTGNGSSDATRGMFEIVTYSSSNQMTSKQSNDPDGFGTIRVLRTYINGLYWWPLGGSQTVARDGTFNIGVDSGAANTSTRLLIDVYSGSSVSNPQTYHLQKAIEVRYGSSSLSTTFCVSSSGQVVATGYSGSNFNQVAFYGSASYALNSNLASTASYASTASVVQNGSSINPLGIYSVTSSLTANNYLGGAYSSSHALGTSPFYFKSVLLCTDAGGDGGYSQNDEIDSVAEYDSVTNNEHTAITSWTNATYVGASFLNSNWNTNKKSDGTSVALTPSKWKIKFYYR